jgi:hypothetical protein
LKLTLHPRYLDSLTKGSCDIALLELEQPVTNITPANLNKGFDELHSKVVGVGYGYTGTGDKHELVKTSNKKIAGENEIDSLAGSTILGNATELLCDFDHPVRKDCNKMGSAQPRPLEYMCVGGDSGGGLFRYRSGGWELVGITGGLQTDIDQFLASAYYGQIMIWTRVSAFTNWIDGLIK